jgi:small-conductance mechanosensitive channel
MYVTLVRDLRQSMLGRAKRARVQALVLLPFVIAVVLAYTYRVQLFGIDTPIRIIAAIALLALGWAFARDLGRATAPILFKRMDPATAGTVGFLIRLFALGVSVLVALRFAGLQPQTVAVGGAITVVILGLASQQTLGNVIAGTVLLSARPFKVRDRVRFQGGPLAGRIEGTVLSLGLLYTTLEQGADTVLVPNSVVLNCAVVPLREAAAVDLRARLRPGVRPSQIQDLLQSMVKTETLDDPHIGLEEIDSEEVVVRIAATPVSHEHGPQLADEILAAIGPVTRSEEHTNGSGDEQTNGSGDEPRPAASSPARPNGG